MESFLPRPLAGDKLLSELLLEDVAKIMCASRKIREAGRRFDGVTAFGLARTSYTLRSMSLRAWSDQIICLVAVPRRCRP